MLFRACYLLPSIFLVRYSIFWKAFPEEAFHTLTRGSSLLDPPYSFIPSILLSRQFFVNCYLTAKPQAAWKRGVAIRVSIG